MHGPAMTKASPGVSRHCRGPGCLVAAGPGLFTWTCQKPKHDMDGNISTFTLAHVNLLGAPISCADSDAAEAALPCVDLQSHQTSKPRLYTIWTSP